MRKVNKSEAMSTECESGEQAFHMTYTQCWDQRL